jgi:hypothetical protein
VARVFASREAPEPTTKTDHVVDAVWRPATDPAVPMRMPAGANAVALA